MIATAPETETETVAEPTTLEEATTVESAAPVEAESPVETKPDELKAADESTFTEEIRFRLYRESLFEAKGIELTQAKYDFEDANETAKSRKKRVELLETELHQISQMKYGDMPLLDGLKQDTPAKYQDPPTSPMPSDAPPKLDESWRSMPTGQLSAYGVKANHLVKLEENHPSITTLGALSDWMKQKGDWWAKDIRGIGEKAAETIMDAFTAFWKDNPRFCGAPPVDEPAPSATEDATPDDSDPFEEGRQTAFIGGDPKCPYEEGSTSASEWEAGFDSGFAGPKEEPASAEAETPPKTPEWTAGYEAYKAGEPRNSNPHARGSSQWDDWREGFDARMKEELDMNDAPIDAHPDDFEDEDEEPEV